jgi:hypothetical protein
MNYQQGAILPTSEIVIPLHLQIPLMVLTAKHPALQFKHLYELYLKNKGYLLIMGEKYHSEPRAEVVYVETRDEARQRIGTGRPLFSVFMLSFDEVFGLFPIPRLQEQQPAMIQPPPVL